MKRELSGEIIPPKDFSKVLATFHLPRGEQERWLIRWGRSVGLSLLSVVCLSVALVSGQITSFQLLLGALALLLWVGVSVFFPVPMAAVSNGRWNAGAIGPSCGDSSPSRTSQEGVSKHVRQIHSRWLQIATFLIFVLLWCSQWETILKGWGVQSPLLLWDLGWIQLVILGLDTLMASVASLCLARLLLVAIALHRVFSSFTIPVSPLPPDGSGGLGALRQLVWVSNVMLIAGVGFAASFSSRAMDHVVLCSALCRSLVYRST